MLFSNQHNDLRKDPSGDDHMEKQWTVRLFAGLAERLGGSEIIVTAAEDGMTAGKLKELIAGLHPAHAGLIRTSFVARNEEYAPDEEPLAHGDELALLPPVSGGAPEEGGEDGTASADGCFLLTRKPLDANTMLSRVIVPEHGASLVFVGTTREWTAGRRTIHLEYEAYAPMALKTMRQIGDEVASKWPGARCAIAHRIGTVPVGEASVVIAVSAPHRAECYEASRYAIDRLKEIVPIWKKETREDGTEWVGEEREAWDPTAPADKRRG
jgi:molybdopterin synthase catalytic subunit